MLYTHHEETYQTRVGAGWAVEVLPLPTLGHIPYSGLASASPPPQRVSPGSKLNISTI